MAIQSKAKPNPYDMSVLIKISNFMISNVRNVVKTIAQSPKSLH